MLCRRESLPGPQEEATSVSSSDKQQINTSIMFLDILTLALAYVAFDLVRGCIHEMKSNPETN